MDNTVNILGVSICRDRIERIIDKIDNSIINNNKIYFCLTNAATLVEAQKNEKFRNASNSAFAALPDGMPLVWLSWFLKKTIPGRIPGAELFGALSKLAQKKGYSYYFMGTDTDTLQRIKKRVNKKYPNINIKGFYAPPFEQSFSQEQNDKIITEINASSSDVLWVGMSAPKQEIWISENIHRLNIKVAIGIGAAFNFLSGKVIRAPLIMQKIGLEWFWRLLMEPRRLWKRYLITNIQFIIILIKSFKKNNKK